MDRKADKPVVLWDKDFKEPTNLRQPNMSLISSTSMNATKTAPITVNSKLSADAPEWYPRTYQVAYNPPYEPPTSAIQNRLKVHKKAAAVVPQVPETPDFSSDVQSSDMQRLKQIVNTLTKDPGQFDSLLDIFMETLIPYFNDVIVLSDCAQWLVDQSITNTNFRYTGARLCYYIEEDCPEFRAALHLICTKEIEKNANKQNILLFVAELFTQLHHLSIYGTLLFDCFQKMIAQGGNDNIKCICQALKLTGYSLEKYDKKNMDQLFVKLESIQGWVEGSASLLLHSVFDLRNNNWGKSSDASSSAEDDEVYYEPTNASFCDSSGRALSSEENEFLASHMYSTEDCLSDSYDPDELVNPEPEMDQEIRDAFKEFMKLSKR